MSKHWIRFTAEINQKSFDRLAVALDSAVAHGATEMTILMTSGGGTTKLGTAAFNLLTTTPIETTIYNMGHVESAGVTAFAGGKHRFTVPTARFLIHKAGWSINERLTRDQFAEKIAILDREHDDYFQIFSGIFTCGHDEIHDALRVGRVFAATDAKSVGLVHDIQTPSIPAGTRIVAITDN